MEHLPVYGDREEAVVFAVNAHHGARQAHAAWKVQESEKIR